MSQWFLKIKYYIYTDTLPLPINALNLDLMGSRGRKWGLCLLHFKMLQSQTYIFEGKKKKRYSSTQNILHPVPLSLSAAKEKLILSRLVMGELKLVLSCL